MVYADYDYYSNVYLGTAISSDDFQRFAMKASTFLDYATMGRAGKHSGMDAVKMACCAVAEDYQTIDTARSLANKSLSVSLDAVSGGSGELQSQTVGSWSKTYKSGGSSASEAIGVTSNAQETMFSTAAMYLSGTGLLRARGYYA